MVNTICKSITEREKFCLYYLADKMELTAAMLGEAMTDNGFIPECDMLSGQSRIVLGNLRKKGFVMRLPELRAWRLTREGRDYVNQ